MPQQQVPSQGAASFWWSQRLLYNSICGHDTVSDCFGPYFDFHPAKIIKMTLNANGFHSDQRHFQLFVSLIIKSAKVNCSNHYLKF
jgi:hypothetical protein